MSNSKNNKYCVDNNHRHTHSYWFYTRGFSINTDIMDTDVRALLWKVVYMQDEVRINKLLLSNGFRICMNRIFQAMNEHDKPGFLLSKVDFQVSHMIREGFELKHDTWPETRHFYVKRCGFWADTKDGQHHIKFMFCWDPNDDPNPQSVDITYTGPQRFKTYDNEFFRLMEEKMQGPHSL